MVRERSVETLDCAAVRSSFGGWLRSSDSVAAGSARRAHMRACASCREAFLADLERLSELTRGGHAERLRRQWTQRRAHQRGLALAGAFEGTWGRLRSARLRLLIMPALAIFLVTSLSRPPGSVLTVRAQTLQGSVWLAGTSLPADTGPRALLRGEGCATGADGAAHLGSKTASVELEPLAQAWLESHSPARFRLGTGRFKLQGDLTATTRWGVLECQGATVHAHVLSDAVELRVLDGRVRCTDRSGERTLAGGERVVLR